MKKVFIVLMVCLVAITLTSCASLFGGGDWKAEAANTVKVEYDEFTQETTYSMVESGLYYAYLPVKLEFTESPNKLNGLWQITVQNKDVLAKTNYVSECSILNSRDERFLLDNMYKLPFISEFASGYGFIDIDEVNNLYAVMKDTDSLDYIRIRFSANEIYDMTQPQAYAITNFIDYVKSNAASFKAN